MIGHTARLSDLPAVTLRNLEAPSVRTAWRIATFAGRLAEISTGSAGSPLTLAFRLVLEAQRGGEPVAWIARRDAFFFPPDAADAGIDLSALPVVWAPDAVRAAEATDLLARSGAFGLLMLDLGNDPRLPLYAQARLVALAQKHETAIVCLTTKDRSRPSVGSLVSLRAHAVRPVHDEGSFRCEALILKDKHRGPGWRHAEVCRGPDGLH
jgi:recombination protein RecA